MSEAALSETETPPAAACPRACPRHAARGPLLAVAGWLAAGLAALSLATISADFDESLCGVWGCVPPIAPMVAMHLFWCVVLGAGVHALWRWRPGLLRPVGAVLVLAAGVTTAVVVGNDLSRWLDIADSYRAFWPRRVAYILATSTDLPLVQSLVAGFVCLILARRHRVRRGNEHGKE